MVNAQRVFLKENSHFLQDRPHGPVFLFENPPIMHFQIRKRWYKKFPPGPPPGPPQGPGRKTYDQHESLRLRRRVLQFTLPTSREHITLTHSHSRTYTPKDIIRTQKINLLGKKHKEANYSSAIPLQRNGQKAGSHNLRSRRRKIPAPKPYCL